MALSGAAAAGVAALPLVAILGLMLGARWPAARAGGVGLALALVLAWFVFGLGTVTFPELGPVRATLGALAEAVFTAGAVLWIVFPALSIYHLQQRIGALETIRSALTRVAADPRITALLAAWFFALFIEGAAGFGTTIALIAPLLVGLGFKPVTAVALVLVGHTPGVTFGAVGTPIIPQLEITGASALAVSQANAIYQSVLGWVPVVAVTLLVAAALGKRPGPREWGWAAVAAALFLAPYTLVAFFVGPELPTLAGALVGGVAFALLVRSREPQPAGAEPGPSALALLKAGSPYLVLLVLILVTRLIVPVQEVLRSITLAWELEGGFTGSFEPLYHPGTMLLLAFLIGAVIERSSLADIRFAMGTALRQLLPVAVALVAMLGLARVLVAAGMVDAIAVFAAGAGVAWPLLAPFIGALGTFVTGSATASNILFGDFQEATATQLDLPLLPMIGVQAFGAALGNAVAPHNVIAGCATVGETGREGAIMRLAALPVLVSLVLGGLLALWLTHG